MTKQELFNKIVRGFAAQDWRRSLNEEDGCMYRNQDGARCAVGFLIDDEYYHHSFEGQDVGDDQVLLALNASGVAVELYGPIYDFLAQIQRQHDAWRDDLKTRMKTFARNNELEWPADV